VSRTIVVLGCGKEKREGYHPLVDLYKGPLYRKRLAFAQQLGGPHWIISAFYGCKPPDYTGWPYDREMSKLTEAGRRWVDSTVLMNLDAQPGDRVVALASRLYVEGWVPQLRRRGVIVDLPLEGLQMGEQLHRLTRLLAPVGEVLA
jgi:hypothetical protein